MKQENLRKFQNVLKKVRLILANSDEQFDELRKKEKQQIFALFFDNFEYEIDEYSVSFEINDFNVVFFSNANDFDDFKEDITSMYVDEEQQKNTLQAIDVILKSIEEILAKKEVIGILNTSILTTAGEYKLENISLDEAKELICDCDIDSAVGHEATAQFMTRLLGKEIPAKRQVFQQKVDQRCLVFKLRGRPAEGKILSADEIEEIGYDFQLLTREN